AVSGYRLPATGLSQRLSSGLLSGSRWSAVGSLHGSEQQEDPDRREYRVRGPRRDDRRQRAAVAERYGEREHEPIARADQEAQPDVVGETRRPQVAHAERHRNESHHGTDKRHCKLEIEVDEVFGRIEPLLAEI